MNEMIERVAQALCGDENPANILAIHRTRARAAIEAMREPTIEMLNAYGSDLEESYQYWTHMHAAALK